MSRETKEEAAENRDFALQSMKFKSSNVGMSGIMTRSKFCCQELQETKAYCVTV